MAAEWHERIRFSRNGIIFAPLLAPAVFSATWVFVGMEPQTPRLAAMVLGFLVVMIPCCVISYGTTVCLFLPCLVLLSHWCRMNALSVSLLGLVLGTVVVVPIDVLFWTSSGPDSGPPAERFWDFFLRWIADPFEAVFPASGLITAGTYWALGTRRHRLQGQKAQ